MPVNKKLKLLVAWAMWSSVPAKKINSGASKMPPTPTVPMSVPVSNPIKMNFRSKRFPLIKIFGIITYGDGEQCCKIRGITKLVETKNDYS